MKTKTKTKAKPIGKTTSKALSTDVAAMQEDAGIGQETMTSEDFAIPRITILQALSPQMNKQNGEYIPDADVGDIMDTASKELFNGDEGITIVPISYRRAYIEWKQRTDSGGGFVADHGSSGNILNECSRDEKGRDMTKAGTQIVTTAEYFVFVVDIKTGIFRPSVLSMSSTQLKKSRRWNTMINHFRLPKAGGGTFNPAMFARAYALTTIPESNEQGSWFGWSIAPSSVLSELGDFGMEVYGAAKDFRAKILSGEVKAAAQTEDVAGAQESEDDPM